MNFCLLNNMPGPRSPYTRRHMLSTLGSGFGLLAFRAVAAQTLLAETTASPLAPRQGHHPAKAKRVIFLVMNGGLSQVDTFDPKPMLDRYHGQPMPGGNPKTERKT